jgi:hypothetical protein
LDYINTELPFDDSKGLTGMNMGSLLVNSIVSGRVKPQEVAQAVGNLYGNRFLSSHDILGSDTRRTKWISRMSAYEHSNSQNAKFCASIQDGWKDLRGYSASKTISKVTSTKKRLELLESHLIADRLRATVLIKAVRDEVTHWYVQIGTEVDALNNSAETVEDVDGFMHDSYDECVRPDALSKSGETVGSFDRLIQLRGKGLTAVLDLSWAEMVSGHGAKLVRGSTVAVSRTSHFRAVVTIITTGGNNE